MFVITEINEYMLPKILPVGYDTFDEARDAVHRRIQDRGLFVAHESGPEKAIEEWREGWVRIFNKKGEWFVCDVTDCRTEKKHKYEHVDAFLCRTVKSVARHCPTIEQAIEMAVRYRQELPA